MTYYEILRYEDRRRIKAERTAQAIEEAERHVFADMVAEMVIKRITPLLERMLQTEKS